MRAQIELGVAPVSPPQEGRVTPWNSNDEHHIFLCKTKAAKQIWSSQHMTQMALCGAGLVPERRW